MTKIEKVSVFLSIIFIALFIAYSYVSSIKTNIKGVSENLNKEISNNKILETKNDKLGAVDVIVEPINTSKYKIYFNTHSVNLSYDFKNVISLKDDYGKEYKALEWSGGQGGHHLSGEITFETVSKDARELILSINGVDNNSTNFIWSLLNE